MTVNQGLPKDSKAKYHQINNISGVHWALYSNSSGYEEPWDVAFLEGEAEHLDKLQSFLQVVKDRKKPLGTDNLLIEEVKKHFIVALENGLVGEKETLSIDNITPMLSSIRIDADDELVELVFIEYERKNGSKNICIYPQVEVLGDVISFDDDSEIGESLDSNLSRVERNRSRDKELLDGLTKALYYETDSSRGAFGIIFALIKGGFTAYRLISNFTKPNEFDQLLEALTQVIGDKFNENTIKEKREI